MQNETFQLRYLPLFEQDLLDTVDYITNVLQNEGAAQRLVDDVETAILKRLDNPLSFEPYHSAKKRDYPYYRIYVRNHTVFYVVISNVILDPVAIFILHWGVEGAALATIAGQIVSAILGMIYLFRTKTFRLQTEREFPSQRKNHPQNPAARYQQLPHSAFI